MLIELVVLLVVLEIQQGTVQTPKVVRPVPLQVAAAAAAAAAVPGIERPTVRSACSAVLPTWRLRMCSATSVGSDPLVTGGLPVVREVRVGEAWLPKSAVVLCGAYWGE